MRDLHHGAERQRPVSRRQAIRAGILSVGGTLAGIDRRNAGLPRAITGGRLALARKAGYRVKVAAVGAMRCQVMMAVAERNMLAGDMASMV